MCYNLQNSVIGALTVIKFSDIIGFTASRLHGFTASRLHGFTASRPRVYPFSISQE
ncbi:MAG: hypothetical protein IJT21_02495 [Synergistaceae bacterium]|nr:hypothetical protein [Synergistaceae bacterium]